MAQFDEDKLTEALKEIRLLLLDVDGVLTDGGITYGDRGEEIKTFNVKDGLGIRLLMDAGIEVGVVTGRSSKALYHRCRNLGITRLHDGVTDKVSALSSIRAETGLSEAQIAFVGDDLPDLEILSRVGLPITVADADAAVCEKAAWVTSAPGGKGAVREVCEAILKARGLWQETVRKFLT
jgi:3-deoxy-D-manno-octulosonate 8-phosphate phosphatase (KDO 8-P phosphatase)